MLMTGNQKSLPIAYVYSEFTTPLFISLGGNIVDVLYKQQEIQRVAC